MVASCFLWPTLTLAIIAVWVKTPLTGLLFRLLGMVFTCTAPFGVSKIHAGAVAGTQQGVGAGADNWFTSKCWVVTALLESEVIQAGRR